MRKLYARIVRALIRPALELDGEKFKTFRDDLRKMQGVGSTSGTQRSAGTSPPARLTTSDSADSQVQPVPVGPGNAVSAAGSGESA